MFEVAILFSGRGSNLRSILDRSFQDDAQYRVRLTVTDNPRALGIAHSHECGTPCVVLPKEGWDWRLYDTVQSASVQLIVLAGFMKIIPLQFANLWKRKCINIHPSLLPKYKGLRTHSRALALGDTEHGCSIHYVIPELDSGPVIAQSRVPILEGDTEATLTDRVLEQENLLYPEVIQAIAAFQITNEDEQIFFKGNPIASPLTLNDLR